MTGQRAVVQLHGVAHLKRVDSQIAHLLLIVDLSVVQVRTVIVAADDDGIPVGKYRRRGIPVPPQEHLDGRIDLSAP